MQAAEYSQVVPLRKKIRIFCGHPTLLDRVYYIIARAIAKRQIIIIVTILFKFREHARFAEISATALVPVAFRGDCARVQRTLGLARPNVRRQHTFTCRWLFGDKCRWWERVTYRETA